MSNDLHLYRSRLATFLTTYLAAHSGQWQGSRWGADIISRLEVFCVTGKLFRGCLLLESYHLFSGKSIESVLPLAAAIELMQSSLLIHDDLIDQDLVRRGQPSIPAQYRTLAEEKKYRSQMHAGDSLALCVGDIGFFLAFELLGQMYVSSQVYAQLLSSFAREYQVVGLGEMDDVHLAFTREAVTEVEILEVYRSKTARYTLVMPMLLAAIAAKADQTLVTQLESLLEKFGLIFQIKDDELGIFGTESQTGKPITSDVREGKKTLYYFHGMALAAGKQRQLLSQAFGNSHLTLTDLEQVKAILRSCGAVTAVDQQVAQLETQVHTELQALTSPTWQHFLTEFLHFNLQRQR